MSKLLIAGVAVFGTVTIVAAIVFVLTSIVGLDLVSAFVLLGVAVVGLVAHARRRDDEED